VPEHQGGDPSHTSYNAGCRCRWCKIAHTEYRRDQRAKERGEVAPLPTPDDPLPDDAPLPAPAPGPCEVQTRAELESLPAYPLYLAEGEALIALSRLIDGNRYGTTLPSATARLFDGLQRIRQAKSAPSGRLYDVAKMSQRGRKPAG
jgi:hypothetical protein